MPQQEHHSIEHYDGKSLGEPRSPFVQEAEQIFHDAVAFIEEEDDALHTKEQGNPRFMDKMTTLIIHGEAFGKAPLLGEMYSSSDDASLEKAIGDFFEKGSKLDETNRTIILRALEDYLERKSRTIH